MEISPNIIQVFEHGSLSIGSHKLFEERHWKRLGWYNEVHGGKYFTLTPNGIKFNQYVGVIQIDNLTIEILPKIGKTSEKGSEAKWQKVLVDMLRECKWMHVYANEKASLRFKPNSILEAYLELFIQECEKLSREGLVKKYRKNEGNKKELIGNLIFSKQIQHNLVHAENFYTSHCIYDRNNIYNKLLLKALKIIPEISCSPAIKDKVYQVIFAFPDLDDVKVDSYTFNNLVFNHKTEGYREALEMAAMILLNYRPDVQNGRNNILAILFDMNDLWEEYLFRQIYRFKPVNWTVRGQSRKLFWQASDSTSCKIIKPDLTISKTENGVTKTVVLDTKWKIPDKNIPSDADLKQMFAYNEFWDGLGAVLLYPNALFSKEPVYVRGKFKKNKEEIHECGMMKVSVLGDGIDMLDKTIGKRINDFIDKEIFK